jgi:hypothetical protein
MSDGITVMRIGNTITITTTVGEKVARVRVTREYANKLAARLMVAAAHEHEPSTDGEGRYVDA